MSTKEAQEKLIDNMERWMKVEDLAVKTTGEIAGEIAQSAYQACYDYYQTRLRDASSHPAVDY